MMTVTDTCRDIGNWGGKKMEKERNELKIVYCIGAVYSLLSNYLLFVVIKIIY